MQQLDLRDFQYTLPQEKIAVHPLKNRDQSKLLFYHQGHIKHSLFSSMADFLPSHSFLFFNDTRVIPARILFQKQTGADIEIFLLNPVQPSTLLGETMQSMGKCAWNCVIGNLKRWPDELVLTKNLRSCTLEARLANRKGGIVEFRWDKNIAFAEVVDEAGITPLPPYLKRAPVAADKQNYQTIYSQHDGAVAAPTAGLHFTDGIFESLLQKNIGHDFLTLHVSAGTFQPIKSQNVNEHVIHQEQVIVTRKNIENLMDDEKFIVSVGTTSMRTLESLYWYGAKLLSGDVTFEIKQDDPYLVGKNNPPQQEALKAILDFMTSNNTDCLTGTTSIFIRPGYRFKICKGLITNFHQPGSTLILLVAAFIGENWKNVYKEALGNNYRFLSYGDSSLLIPENYEL